MKVPFGKPFPAIDPVSLRDGVAAGLINGYINELDDYPMVPGHNPFTAITSPVIGTGIARHFNGDRDVDFLYLPTSSETYTGITLYGWMQADDTGFRRGIMGRLYDYHNGWALFVDENQMLTFFSTGDPIDDPSQFAAIACPDLSLWRFIAISYDLTDVKFYASDPEGPASTIALIGTVPKTGGFGELFIYGTKWGAVSNGHVMTGGALLGWKGGLDNLGVRHGPTTLAELQALAVCGTVGDLTSIKEIIPINGTDPEPSTANGGAPDSIQVFGTTVITGAVGCYFATTPPAGIADQSVDAIYETLSGMLLTVVNGSVVRVNVNGTFDYFTGDTVTAHTFYYWAEDGQHVYLAHGGKLARLDLTNLIVTLLNENTPSAVTHVVRSKGFLLCNGNDRIMTSTSFELAQVFDTSELTGAVTMTDRDGWILMSGGIAALPGQGRIYLSKDNGLSWEKVYGLAGLSVLGNEAVISLCYMGSGVVLAGTTGYDDGFILNRGRLLRSTNYGQNWSDLGELGTNLTIPIIAKITTNIAIAGGTELLRSVDNGITWTPVTPASFPNIVGTCLVWSSSIIFIGVSTAGNEAHIWKSVDAGETFTDTTTLDAGASIVASVKVADVGLVSVQVSGSPATGKIYRTTDTGTIWTYIGDIGLTDGMIPVAFLLTSTGDLIFAASGNSVASQLWKSTDEGLIWTHLAGDLDLGDQADGSIVNALAETHTEGQLLIVGRLSYSVPYGSNTAAKWQMGVGRNAPQGDVFFSEDVANHYENVDSWERFNAQSVPDAVTGVYENRGLVYTGGPRSIEINYSSGNADIPWAVSDPALPYGLGAPHSWVNWDDLNTVMYLSCSDKVWEIVKFQGRQQQSISQVYSAIINDRTLVTSPSTAKAWGINMRGIPMYVLSFQDDSLTICYNLIKDHWFRWAYWNGANYEAALINSYCYSRVMNKHLIGDRRANGKIHELTGTSDDGGSMRFELTSGHLTAGNFLPKTVGRMLFKCKRGAAIDSSEPAFTWATRDNGNPTFGTSRSVSLGLTNDTELLGSLNRCGMYNTRQQRIVYLGSKTDFIFSEADES